jgi:anti-sigma B factor antagonist
MPSINLQVSYWGENREVALIDMEGFIDSTTTPEITSIIDRQLNLGVNRMIIHLKNVDYISNSGWDALLSKLKKTREAGGDIVLAKMAKNIQELFELMELSYVFKFFTTVGNAKTHFLSRGKPPKAKPEKIPETLSDLRQSHPPIPSLANKNLLGLELPDRDRLN